MTSRRAKVTPDQNMRCDYLDANQLGRAPFTTLVRQPRQPPNSARFGFLDPTAREFFTDWDKLAKGLVAALRQIAGRNPYAERSQALSASCQPPATRSEAALNLLASWAATHESCPANIRPPTTRSAFYPAPRPTEWPRTAAAAPYPGASRMR